MTISTSHLFCSGIYKKIRLYCLLAWLWEQYGCVLDGREVHKQSALVKSVTVYRRGIQTSNLWGPFQPSPFHDSVVLRNSSSALKVDAKSWYQKYKSFILPWSLIPGPYLALLFFPCSSPLAEQCVLPAVCASAAETDCMCHGDTLASRWEKSIASSHCSSVKTQFNKPTLQLQEQFPLTDELILPNEFHLGCSHTLFYVYITIITQWTKYNQGRLKLQVATETIWQSFGMTAFLASSTHLAVYTNSGLWAGPYSCQPIYLTSRKITWDKAGGNSFNSEFHWLW